jgi:putative ABC transport system permease protein
VSHRTRQSRRASIRFRPREANNLPEAPLAFKTTVCGSNVRVLSACAQGDQDRSDEGVTQRIKEKIMPLLPRLSSLCRNLFRKARRERELTEEIDAYLEMLVEQKINEGLDPEAARRAAMIELGGREQVKEKVRDAGVGHQLETLWQDLRYAARMLGRNPGFAAVAALTLALGIGANTAIFSVVNAVLLRPLPYAEPERLVTIFYHHPILGLWIANDETFLKWREANAFEKVAAYTEETVDLSGGGESERLTAALVSADLFSTLGVSPALGRVFTPDEDKAGGAPVVILSHALWRRRFSGDPQIVGRSITLDGKSHTVVAIMPPGFRFPGEQDLWKPLALDVSRVLRGEATLHLEVIARLKSGATLESARSDLSLILERQKKADPKQHSDLQVSVTRLSEQMVRDVREALLALFGAVAFVLLIACANVANLLLARAAVRQKEMAIRAAVGAGRFRLVRQLLTESLLLSFAGGFAGLLAANWGVKLLVKMNPGNIARLDESVVDGRVLIFTGAVAALVGLLAGILPALQASKTDVNGTLKAQSVSGTFVRSGPRMLPALMIAELALTLVLTIGAGLLVRSFLQMVAVPKGFNPDGVLTLELAPNLSKYPWDGPQRGAYYQELLARVQALPGIQSAGLTSFLPLARPSMAVPIQVEGRPPIVLGKEPFVIFNQVSRDYFQTMGMQVRAGRPFSSQDAPKAQLVAIINETVAQRYFANENPIGRRFLPVSWKDAITVVGVVGDTRQFGLDREVNLEVFLPDAQSPGNSNMLVTRVAPGQNNQAGLSGLSAAIRDQARALDPGEPVYQVVKMNERLSDSFAPRRFQTLLFGAFAALALAIAAVGIYGVVSYAVSRRTHEIGVRMALGATPRDALKMVIRQGMLLALIGVGLGVAAALALTRVMKSLLFNVSANDPATFVGVALLLVAVALIASYIPARRATKVDPLQALRQE